jgi:HEAT repeat protein
MEEGRFGFESSEVRRDRLLLQESEMPSKEHMAEWIELLGSESAAEREAARVALHHAGTKAVPAMLEALAHPYWRVRRGCARVLDHQPLTGLIAERLIDLLEDKHRKVREAALHTLACEGCKPEGCDADLPEILSHVIDRALNDESTTVRRQAVGALLNARPNARAAEALEDVFREERSVRVLRIARFALPLEERKVFLAGLTG